MSTLRTALYLRESEDDQQGIDRHRDDCLAMCQRKNWIVADQYVDNDESASPEHRNGKPRPGLTRMLADVRAGKIDRIVCWHADRLYRHPRELEDIIDICTAHKVGLVTVNGELDLSNDTGRTVARILGAVARGEVERKSARQKLAMLQRATKGGRAWWPHRPFGYTMPTGRRGEDYQKPKLVKGEADAIRDAYQAVLAGDSLRSIAREWNAKGLTTPTKDSGGSQRGGQPWTGNAVRAILVSPRNAALRVYAPKSADGKIGPKEVVGAGDWPQIVSEELWRGVVAKLSDPARLTNGGSTARKYMLSGLAVCGKCGATMGSHIRTKRPTYVCKSCLGTKRSVTDVDAWVVGLVVERLSRPDAVDLLVNRKRPDLAELRDRASALRARQDEVSAELTDLSIPVAKVKARLADLAGQLAEIEAKMSDNNRSHIFDGLISAQDVRARFAALGLDRQRAVINALLTVTILPGQPPRGAFRTELVPVRWKDGTP